MTRSANKALFPAITHPKKRGFLLAYLECGQLRHTCRSVQVDHKSHYYWLKHDPAYKAAFAEARDLAASTLEDEAIRRARDGVVRPVYYLGEVVGEEIVYSDTLLMLLLKGAMPERYGTKVQGDLTLQVQQAAEAVAAEMGIDVALLLREAQEYLTEAPRAQTPRPDADR
jgi:hypothetical protein